jgi:translation initiation factor 1
MAAGGKIQTGGGGELLHNPFGGLSGAGLPAASANGALAKAEEPGPVAPRKPSRGRVDIVRETGGRGGKTVTVVAGFTGIGLPEKERLARRMRAACGCGGTVKDGRIEIQGDHRETLARILAESGFRPVFAGG